MEVRMDGRNAIVTGGSLGLGKAVAMEFARSGAHVALVARRQGPLDQAKAEIEKVGAGKVIAVAADIRLAGDCRRAVAEAEAALGPIDVLVNNAGTSQRGPFLEVSDELWQDDLDLKLFASIRLSRLVLPGMRERRWGRIINVLNVGAKTPPAEVSAALVSPRAAAKAVAQQEPRLKAVTVKSGDCLVFGNGCRDMFHGVEEIIAGTAPPDLKMTKPGRLMVLFK